MDRINSWSFQRSKTMARPTVDVVFIIGQVWSATIAHCDWLIHPIAIDPLDKTRVIALNETARVQNMHVPILHALNAHIVFYDILF